MNPNNNQPLPPPAPQEPSTPGDIPPYQPPDPYERLPHPEGAAGPQYPTELPPVQQDVPPQPSAYQAEMEQPTGSPQSDLPPVSSEPAATVETPGGFIEPRLDYDSSYGEGGGFWNRKKLLLLLPLLLLLLIGGGIGVFMLLNGSNKADDTSQVAETDEETDIYEGDGSDIVESVPPTTTWECPEGTTAKGEGSEMTCTGTFTNTKAAKKSVQCPSSYIKYGDNNNAKCQRTTGGTRQTIPATVSYSCPSGYSRSGSTCSRTVTRSASVSYHCPSGYSRSGTVCTRTISATATIVRYTCPSGYKKTGTSENQKCVRTVMPGRNGKCPPGYKKQNGRCTRTINATPVYSYSCPSGYVRSGATCYRRVSATKSYHCPSGYSRSGTVCRRVVRISANRSYSCPATYYRSGTTCIRYVGGNVQTAEPIVSYSCSKGYKRQGSNCIKRTSTTRDAQEVYTCEDGWELREDEGIEPQCVQIDV